MSKAKLVKQLLHGDWVWLDDRIFKMTARPDPQWRDMATFQAVVPKHGDSAHAYEYRFLHADAVVQAL